MIIENIKKKFAELKCRAKQRKKEFFFSKPKYDAQADNDNAKDLIPMMYTQITEGDGDGGDC